MYDKLALGDDETMKTAAVEPIRFMEMAEDADNDESDSSDDGSGVERRWLDLDIYIKLL